MRISKLFWRPAAFGSLALLLAGCLEPTASPTQTPGSYAYTRSAPRSDVLVSDAVQVAGPQGYCVDRRAGRGGLMILASCASVTGQPNAPRPLFEMLLTASASPEEDGDTPILQQLPQLERFFAAPAGLAALSRDGRPESVRLVDTSVHRNAFVIHSRHTGTSDIPGLGADQWRALFNLNGQMVSASVSSLAQSPVSSDAGLANLLDFISQIRTVSQFSGDDLES